LDCIKSSGFETAANLINYFDKYNVFAIKNPSYGLAMLVNFKYIEKETISTGMWENFCPGTKNKFRTLFSRSQNHAPAGRKTKTLL
jgi:hypothetical protein